ncbi:MAG: type II toxin-antitoxin system RelE/ParE family toxin [Chakrabartia sp.]
MFELRQTQIFAEWLADLKDIEAVKLIKRRVARLEAGLFGDTKHVGHGVLELRVHHGPGYRVYFVRRAGVLIILLCGGDKSTQQRDISKAYDLAEQLDE